MEKYKLTGHIRRQMRRRGISEKNIITVLEDPGQREEVKAGRWVYQSIIEYGEKSYLLRVFIDVECKPPEVVTVYRTSKIKKYWRETK